MPARACTLRVAAFILLFHPFLGSYRCDGRDSIREGRREIFGKASFLGGTEERDGLWQQQVDPGSVLQEADVPMYGVGFGHNVTERWNANIEMLYTSTHLTLERPYGFDPAQGTRQIFVFLFNVDYNLLAKPLTPFVSGGIGGGYWQDKLKFDLYDGVVEISSNDLDTETLGFAWTASAGARWDIIHGLFVKVSYGILGEPTGKTTDGISVSVGYMFR